MEGRLHDRGRHPDGYTVVDLEDGTISRYAAGSHSLPGAGLDGTVLTPRGDAVVWLLDGRLYLVPHADFSRPPVEVTLAEVRSIPYSSPTFSVMPSQDGSHLWVVQPAVVSEGLATTLVDLVDADTGTSVDQVEIDLDFRLVGATADALIGNTEELIETEAGWFSDPDSQVVVSVDRDGDTEELAPGTAVAVHGDLVAVLDPSGTDLSLINLTEGRTTHVARPAAERWLTVGGPSIPTTAPPVPTVSPDGELLLATGGDFDENQVPAASTLQMVSLADGTTRSLADFDGHPPDATWSRDGETVVLLDGTGPPDYHGLISLLDPSSTGTEPTVVTELAPDEFALAAG